MNEWIRTCDRLPEDGEHCWLYGNFYDDEEASVVLDGAFDTNSHDYREGKLKFGPGWEYDLDRSDYIMVDQVSHWMPYYTPEAP